MNDYRNDRILVLDQADGSDYIPHCACSIKFLFVPDGDRDKFFASPNWKAIYPMLADGGQLFFYAKI